MSDFYKQVFLREFAENSKREKEFSLFESVGEFYEGNIRKVGSYFSRFQTVKDRISFYKTKVMSDLPNYLIDFESNIAASGAKVIYAEDAGHALAEIHKLLLPGSGLFISKSDVLQEIGLKSYLKKEDIRFFQSDMHKFPYPLLPECSDKILSRLVETYTLEDWKPTKEQVMTFYKKHLIDKLFSSSVVVSGADFLIADIGGAVMVDDSGLDMLYASFCKRHIIVAGIDQLIPSLSDLDYFTSLFSSYSLGSLRAWNEMLITGPKASSELDGPEELIIILLDNGRTSILAHEFQRCVFNCIHCKACLALCPVFKFTNTLDNLPLKGPVNCISDPICKGFEESGFLSFACTQCGKCTEVCPSMINLKELILYNRKDSVEHNAYFSIDRKQMRILKKMFLKQKSLNSSYNRFVLKLKFKKSYGQQREFPDFGKKSFRLLWQEQNNSNI